MKKIQMFFYIFAISILISMPVNAFSYIEDATLLESNEPLYRTKEEKFSWGNYECVSLIQNAIIQYHISAPLAPAVNVGDLSLKRGGQFGAHLSHKTGHDVDIGYVHKGELANYPGFSHATKKNLDIEKTWKLVISFIETDKVEYIFMDFYIQRMLYKHANKKGYTKEQLSELFQYPKKDRTGIIRTSAGHDDHFHVRFKD